MHVEQHSSRYIYVFTLYSVADPEFDLTGAWTLLTGAGGRKNLGNLAFVP